MKDIRVTEDIRIGNILDIGRFFGIVSIFDVSIEQLSN